MRTITLTATLLALTAAGCSPSDVVPDTHKVSGRVLLPSGKPARGAEVLFIPKTKDGKLSGANGSAVLGSDGTFSLKSMGDRDGVPSGYYAVVVNPNVLRGPAAADKPFGVANVPKKYWDENTTDLFVTIDGDRADLTLQLK